MSNKQKAIQIYMHLRRFLSPEESIKFVSDRVPSFSASMSYFENVYATKLSHAKSKGVLDRYHYTY